MTCREVVDFIMDYTTGELPDHVRDVFEQHMSQCPDCREYLAQYQTATQLGRRAFDVEDASAIASDVPEELIAAILAARPH